METILTWLAVTVAGLFVSARTHVTVTAPVHAEFPVLALVALAMMLTAAAGALWAVRNLVTEGLRLRPRMVET